MKQTFQTLNHKDRKESAIPLFDRLCLDKDEEMIVNFDEFKDSVQRELEVILNTRPTAKEWDFTPVTEPILRSLPDYFGLRDFTFQQASHDLGRQQIAQEIKRVIQFYEPRLNNVYVKFNLVSPHYPSVLVSITGDISYGNLKERASFPLQIINLLHHNRAV